MSDKPILNQYEIDVLRECNGEPWPRVLERLRSLSTKEREAYVDDRLVVFVICVCVSISLLRSPP